MGYYQRKAGFKRQGIEVIEILDADGNIQGRDATGKPLDLPEWPTEKKPTAKKTTAKKSTKKAK